MERFLWTTAALFALALPVHAEDVSRPTMQDMHVWKQKVIAQYEKAVYLDERSRPIGEEEFMKRVVDEKRGHSITTAENSKKQIVLRLLSDEELGWTPAEEVNAIKRRLQAEPAR